MIILLNGIGTVLSAYLGWISDIITSFMADSNMSTLIMIPIVAGLIMLVIGIFKSFFS